MKKMCLILLCVTLIVPFTAQAQQSDVGQTMATGLGRGIINFFTGIVELPRAVTYDTIDYGFIGFFSGLGKGLAFTGGRMLCGVSDVVTLGFLPYENSMYNAFNMTHYVWEEPWRPQSGTQLQSPDSTLYL